MSDLPGNDGSKDKESEVTSSCNDGSEVAATDAEPTPRSLSPDTSDAVEDQAGPSHACDIILTSTTVDSNHQVTESTSERTDKYDTKSSSSDEYFEADGSNYGPQQPDFISGSQIDVAESNAASQQWEIPAESSSRDEDLTSSGQPSSDSATLRMPQKSWEMLLSYESSSEEGEAESSSLLADNSHVAISTTQEASAFRSNSEGRAASSDVQQESDSVSGSNETSGIQEAASSIVNASELSVPGDQVLTSSVSQESHVSESQGLSPGHQLSSTQQQPEMMEEVERRLAGSELFPYSGASVPHSNAQEAEAVMGEGSTNRCPTVSASDELAMNSSVNRRRESLSLVTPQGDVSGSNDSQAAEEREMSSTIPATSRPDSPSTQRQVVRSGGHISIQGETSSSRVAGVLSRSRDEAGTSSASAVSCATIGKSTESSDEEPGSALISSAARRPAEEGSALITSAVSRPAEEVGSHGNRSVLAQQLTVSSASGGGSVLRQIISSHIVRRGSIGPDSTTMDQGNNAAEVSTTEEEQAGQVSTSQSRVESTSWSTSRVSSSVDSSAGHISTSDHVGGLLASRLSRDPMVSTSFSAAEVRVNDCRDAGGASSTTSGLRGLLSSGPRPMGVSSTQQMMGNLSPPTQSQREVVEARQQQAASEGCTSSAEGCNAVKGLATAPGDNAPDKKAKKRKKSKDREDAVAAPKNPSLPGPSSAKDDLSSSLVEQLRKAGVIITPVSSQAENSSSTRGVEVPTNISNYVESAVSSPPRHIPRISDPLDSCSSDDMQMMEMFGKTGKDDTNESMTGDSPVSGGEEAPFATVTLDQASNEHDGKTKRKRRPRKPVEINPDMLRPKRPRRAKEKESEEEKEKDKEKPKRGRKKKIIPEFNPKEQNVEEVKHTVVEASTPEKAKPKEKGKKGTSKGASDPPVRPQDEETRMSAEDSQQSRPEVAFRKGVLPVLDVFAESLVEYQWPLNDRLAESYMIQEQVTQYLGIKSFKRKYPDLKRRPVEPEEREFLQERSLVSEAMCDLGLTAVPSAEVLDIMSADFHDKYEEYRRALRDKQAREISGKQKAAAAANAERGRQVDQKMRAVQSAAKWNASLNRDRREERRCCCDLQTMSVQFPQDRIKAMTREVAKLGTYPVPLIPGQFTDFYKRYTPTELRYLPLNTVMYGPLRPNEEEEEEKGSEGSHSDTEDSSSSDESTSSSSSDGTQDTEETGSTAAEPEQDVPSASAATGPASKCKVCAAPGEGLVVCAQCNSSGHLICLGLSADMLPHIRRYAWQCTDCKTCIQCKDPADEDKMLFCDMCDRGYHIYCVGLRKVPTGRWHCQECAVCGSCGSLDPAGTEATSPPTSPEKMSSQWQHEFKRGEKGTRVYAQTLCVPCSKLWRKGSFCQLCFRCFRKPDAGTMLSCSVCDKWMHAECCSLAPGVDVSKMAGSSFVCEVCQEASHARAPAAHQRMMKMATKV